MVFDRGRADGFPPYLITLNAVIGRPLVAQEVRAFAVVGQAGRLVYATTNRVYVALALGNGEGGVLGRLGETMPLG